MFKGPGRILQAIGTASTVHWLYGVIPAVVTFIAGHLAGVPWPLLLFFGVPLASATGLAVMLSVILYRRWQADRELMSEVSAAPPQMAVRSQPPDRPLLQALFEVGNPTYEHPLPPEHELGRGGFMYRLGIRNDSAEVAALGVVLQVVAALPGATNLPAALRRMHDQAMPPQTRWTIGPGCTEYFNVLSMPHALNSKIMERLGTFTRHMYVHFAPDSIVPWMPIEEPFALVLEIKSDNAVAAARCAFRIGKIYSDGDVLRVPIGFEIWASGAGSSSGR